MHTSVDALVSETLRYACPVPLGASLRAYPPHSGLTRELSGLPHRLVEDDVYEGMHIPRGSFVFANIWCEHIDCPFVSLL